MTSSTASAPSPTAVQLNGLSHSAASANVASGAVPILFEDSAPPIKQGSGPNRNCMPNDIGKPHAMKRSQFALLLALFAATNTQAAPPQLRVSHADTSGVLEFNRLFSQAIRSMNNDAVLRLWEVDGVALLPDTPPIRGKAAIKAMMQKITSAHPNAKMEQFTNECFDILRSSSWASEWCLEHQVVSAGGKPSFDGWGKVLLVLHEQRSGEWRLVREMWNHAEPSEHNSLPSRKE